MPVESISISEVLTISGSQTLYDVRSPSEFQHAHIPGAINIPLFTDEERAEVGTLYKHRSREEAVLRGLDFFGPKMRPIIHQVCSNNNSDSSLSSQDSEIIIHCWRGGMRSAGVAWLLDLYGFKVRTIEGGYKSYRRWVLECFTQPIPFVILGGYTGSLKTRILRCMKNIQLNRVLDLEDLASHKGSAFGGYGLPSQPSQEMFENMLAYEIYRQSSFGGQMGGSEPVDSIWVEDESQRIGRVNIPSMLWGKMRCAPVIFLEIPFEERLENICAEYGDIDRELLVGGVERISKRLGGLEAKTSVSRLMEGDIRGAFSILLEYYDKNYEKALNNRPESKEVCRISVSGKTPEETAIMLLNL
jgi:tRNA 2-selenouridine synthase